MKIAILIGLLLMAQAAASACFNQFSNCGTPLDQYVTENLMRLAQRAQEAREDAFMRNLKCWDDGDGDRGRIVCEKDGVQHAYEYKPQDDYKPDSLLIIAPPDGPIVFGNKAAF